MHSFLIFLASQDKILRKRCSLDRNTVILSDDGDNLIYAYNPDDTPRKISDFPTPSGLTRRMTEEKCRDKIIQFAISQACIITIKNFNISRFLADCIFDTMVSK